MIKSSLTFDLGLWPLVDQRSRSTWNLERHQKGISWSLAHYQHFLSSIKMWLIMWKVTWYRWQKQKLCNCSLNWIKKHKTDLVTVYNDTRLWATGKKKNTLVILRGTGVALETGSVSLCGRKKKKQPASISIHHLLRLHQWVSKPFRSLSMFCTLRPLKLPENQAASRHRIQEEAVDQWNPLPRPLGEDDKSRKYSLIRIARAFHFGVVSQVIRTNLTFAYLR